MIAFQLLAAVIGLTIQSLHAQEPIPSPTPSRSSVQFINATSVQFINLEIKDFHLYTKLKPGAKISGGHFDFTTWKLKATSEMDESAFVEKSLLKTPNTSSTVVLVGNFQWLLDENGKKLKLQADILNFDHELANDKNPNVLTIVNGITDKIIRVSVNESEFKEIYPMSHKTWYGLPDVSEAKAIHGKQTIRLPVKYKGDLNSGIVAFFELNGEINYAAMPQTSF
jgi:hypothetical protein